MKSLRARLLWFLLAAIVVAAGIQAFVAYRTVLQEADDIFDHHMQQMALSLRAGLPPSATVGGLSGLGAGEDNFEFIVQVWTADGIRIFESAEQAALPQRAVLGFRQRNRRRLSNGIAACPRLGPFAGHSRNGACWAAGTSAGLARGDELDVRCAGSAAVGCGNGCGGIVCGRDQLVNCVSTHAEAARALRRRALLAGQHQESWQDLPKASCGVYFE